MKTAADSPGLFQQVSTEALGRTMQELQNLLAEVVNDIPTSRLKKAKDPETAARGLASEAARHAALVTGALALPTGPLGVLLMAPDLVVVWRRQAQLVADIAAVHGRTPQLTRDTMMYCLFRHVSSDAFQDVVARVGHRLVVTPTTVLVSYRIMRVIVGDVLSLLAGRFLFRWLPVLGAGAIAAYSYRDTKEVGATAIEAFARA